jgi:transcriptional regulator with GAF, ATPase, and Fis domain
VANSLVPPRQLHDVLDMSRKLGRPTSRDKTLELIVVGAVSAVPGADYAGVSRGRRGRGAFTAVSSQDAPAKVLDDLQAELAEGPCVDAIWEAPKVYAPSLDNEDRWPRYAAKAVELGVHSSLSLRLYVEGDTLGALNLYAEKTDAFGPDSFALAELFSSHAALALTGADRTAGLQEALSTRDLIGQAKGILMQRFGIDAQRAFAMLVQASQQTNRRLADVAEWLATSITDPSDPGPLR